MAHIQYCLDDLDITGDPYDAQDAVEIRVWEEDSTLIVGLEVNEHGVWLVSTSDGGMFDAGTVVGDRAAALELAERTCR
jgi:hypothetical protein